MENFEEFDREEEHEKRGSQRADEDKRYRSWVFTINNYTEEDTDAVYALGLEAAYVSVGREVGKNGTPHYQGLVSFATLKSFSQIKDLLPRAWLAVKSPRSTFDQAVKYTQKDGDFYEAGERPKDLVEKGQQQRDFWSQQYELVRKRKLSEMDPKVKALHLRNMMYAAELEEELELPKAVKLPGHRSEHHEWHYGVRGSGKSEFCERHPDTYAWDNWTEKEWCNYRGQEYVHMKDVDPSFKRIGFLKNLADVNPVSVFRKNKSNAIIRPKLLVSSNYHPSAWIREPDLSAVLDRFTFYEWTEPYWLGDPKLGVRNPDWYNPKTGERAPPLVPPCPPSPSRCVTTWDVENGYA